jgi:hypothetical protein
MPVSNDTLLRVVRRHIIQPSDKLSVVISNGADRSRYCRIERWTLPVRGWPNANRYRSSPGIEAVDMVRRFAKGLPHADQIADRRHLMENSSRAFLDAVGKSMRQIRHAVGGAVIDPELLTYAERLQYEGYLRRQETNEAILELSKQGTPIRQIVKRTGHSRKLVRDVLRGQRSDVFRTRPSSLENWLPWLDGRWEQGARNALALWREMRARGFPGRSGVVSQWAQRRRLERRRYKQPINGVFGSPINSSIINQWMRVTWLYHYDH